MSMRNLLKDGPRVINVGVEQFFSDIKKQKTKAVMINWKPPIAGNDLLARLRKLKKGGN